MDIEQLTKSQIVLLALLVSFMTSIATGIVTVALMQQAPPTVVQSVNRVIRQTVGQVSSTTFTQSAAAAAATEVKTVVVRDSETVSQAVASASRSVVRIYTNDTQAPRLLGLGVIADASGIVITDVSAIGENSDATLKRSDGLTVRAFVSHRDVEHGIVYLTQATSSTVVDYGVPIMLSASSIQLGDVVVVIGGGSVERIRTGFASTLLTKNDTGTVSILETDIPRSSIPEGAPLIDARGNLIGLSTSVSRAVTESGFIPVSAISQYVQSVSQGHVSDLVNETKK